VSTEKSRRRSSSCRHPSEGEENSQRRYSRRDSRNKKESGGDEWPPMIPPQYGDCEAAEPSKPKSIPTNPPRSKALPGVSQRSFRSNGGCSNSRYFSHKMWIEKEDNGSTSTNSTSAETLDTTSRLSQLEQHLTTIHARTDFWEKLRIPGQEGEEEESVANRTLKKSPVW
jgi:hypothetical protein